MVRPGVCRSTPPPALLSRIWDAAPPPDRFGRAGLPWAYRTVSRESVRAVQAAQATLRSASLEEEAARLDGVTWHALTFASRLVAPG